MIYWLWLPPSQRITDPFWEIRFSHLECVCGAGLQRLCERKLTLRSSGVWISALSLLCCQWYAQWISLWFSAALSIVLHYLLVDKYSVWAWFQYVFIAFQIFKIHDSSTLISQACRSPFKHFIGEKKENNKNNPCPHRRSQISVLKALMLQNVSSMDRSSKKHAHTWPISGVYVLWTCWAPWFTSFKELLLIHCFDSPQPSLTRRPVTGEHFSFSGVEMDNCWSY